MVHHSSRADLSFDQSTVGLLQGETVKLVARLLALLMLLPLILSASAYAQQFQHVVLIVQENRTPDNLFYELCTSPSVCSTQPSATQYDIQTSNWLNKNSKSGVTQPFPVPLAVSYDPGHDHPAFVAMCDPVSNTGPCRMDGAGNESCSDGTCPQNFAYGYIPNTSHIIDPYLALATQYGWANYMFQTNQGPSYPAHQFLFGATSAPSAIDDQQGTFAAENTPGGMNNSGCAAAPRTTVQLIDANGVEDPNNTIFPCFEHNTISDIVTQVGFTWRYYAPTANYIWTAPNSINHICVPSNQKCTGTDWTQNVDLVPADVLQDIANCKLRNMSWVIPTGQNSDHPHLNTGGGPSWVASIVNAIGTSACKDGSKNYWDDTAIIITWDDWGGWYDHESPQFLAHPQGGYQYGFRVPLIVVSAYTPQGYISNNRQDFGSIARFIEHNFLLKEGYLGFADARTGTDLLQFFNFKQQPRSFTVIPAALDANYFLHDKSPPLPPDDD